jgi:hypothetical protein
MLTHTRKHTVRKMQKKNQKQRSQKGVGAPLLLLPPEPVYPSCYITHFNGGRMMFVKSDNTNVYCYKILHPSEMKVNRSSTKQLQPIVDYTDDAHGQQLYIFKTPQYTIHNYKKIFVGHDTEWNNTSIENRLFGYGNTILVVDQQTKVYFIQDKLIR